MLTGQDSYEASVWATWAHAVIEEWQNNNILTTSTLSHSNNSVMTFSLLFSSEVLMDSTTATAELGWTISPSQGVSGTNWDTRHSVWSMQPIYTCTNGLLQFDISCGEITRRYKHLLFDSWKPRNNVFLLKYLNWKDNQYLTIKGRTCVRTHSDFQFRETSVSMFTDGVGPLQRVTK